MNTTKLVALAAVAHPDDIEFMMAGTLLLLKFVADQSTGFCAGNDQHL